MKKVVERVLDGQVSGSMLNCWKNIFPHWLPGAITANKTSLSVKADAGTNAYFIDVSFTPTLKTKKNENHRN